MKWGYVIGLVVIVTLAFSNRSLREAVFGGAETETVEETTTNEKGAAAGRVGEADSTSAMGSEAVR